MLFTVWVVFHVITCIALVLVVLLQSSKGEGLAGSAFGGGGGGMAGAVFGGRGAATFLSKATTVLAILFMFNCGALAYMSAGTRVSAISPDGATSESVVTREAQREMERQAQQQQVAPDSSLIFEPPAQPSSDSAGAGDQ
ncbi:MAG: preprotein translocase subunit SecG [Candidatus Zixiibacteriota bacterium]